MTESLKDLKILQSLADRPDERPRKIAIVDMGSNSFRLIVVEYVPGVSFKIVDEVRESVRVSEGMAELNVLRPAAIDRAARVAQVYASYCRASGIEDIIAVGTSAIRDARNRGRLLMRVKRESDMDVRVLSGEEEAYYGYLAAVNSTTIDNGFVVDMGGGSMQITRVEHREMKQSISLPLGAVRVTEGFLTSDPASSKEIGRLVAHLQGQLADLDWFRREPGMTLVGEGGTLRLIGKLAQKRTAYPLDILHGYNTHIGQVSGIRDELAKLSVSARRRIPGMKPDRADISLGGAVVVHEVMKVGGFEDMTICSQGLREGLFYEHFLVNGHGGTPMFADVRRSSVLNLAHQYRFQERHSQHIAHLTLSMFDQLSGFTNLCGPNERELLWAASMLHDIGMNVDYHDHHKHGSYLVLNSGLPGFSHRDIAMIALMVRYHRKGTPTLDELTSLMHPDDDLRLMQLTALLRIAEQLDRARDGAVRDVALTVQGNHARLALFTNGDEDVALWSVEHHLDVFKNAFNLQLEVVPIPDDEDDDSSG